MLSLGRRRNETIVVIQDGRVIARITVGGISRNAVRLVFDAPPDVKVWREEVLRRRGELE